MTRPTRSETTGSRHRRVRPADRLEGLEARQLLSTYPVYPYVPSDLIRRVQHEYPVARGATPIGANARQLSFLDNDGKVVTGSTRDGDMWTITVHGPGVVIVTDTSPNDGFLNDDIDTIQLVETDLNRTYVTGSVSSSNRILTDGTVPFNRLINTEGTGSIILNGFVLQQTGPQPTGPASIALLGGTKLLAFEAVNSDIDLAVDQPTNILIGDPTTPLTVRPEIRINHIFNTASNGSTGLIDGVPITTPTVNIIVNGEIKSLEMISVTAAPVDASVSALVSPVAYTGRTSVQTFGVDGLKAVGSARNFTVSRTPQPFTSRFSGVDRVGHAVFGGTADAVAIDASNGNIRSLKFLRGLGNPAATQDTSLVTSGTPLGYRGYPAWGLSGGVVATNQIGSQDYGPANLILQHRMNPKDIQIRTSGVADYVARPGNAMTNATIASAGSQGRLHVVGNLWRSMVQAGFDYQSYLAGLDPVRQPSHIGPVQMRGDLVDSIVASTYRPVDGIYGNGNDDAGNGQISGALDGSIYRSRREPGVGFFARRINGHLPSDGGPQYEAPKRKHSVLWRV